MASLTYLGHAGFLFESETAACLVDPWMSPKGAFLGAWRQLPPNDHYLPWLLMKIKSKPTMIYVTHEHEDHYDEETLKVLLPNCAEFYAPRYEDAFLRKLITKLSVQPILVEEGTLQSFHDIEFKVFIDESGINRDSAIFLKTPDLSFLDVNDCKIYDRAAWLLEHCGPIDILACQFSGANMHPICYEMVEEDREKLSLQKRTRKYVAVSDFINNLKPKYYLPSAGPPLFSLPEHFALNFGEATIFPKWWDFQAYLQGRDSSTLFMPLAVGGSVKAEDGEFYCDSFAEKISDDQIKKFVSYYKEVDAKNSAVSAPMAEEVLAFFEQEMNKKLAVLKNYPKTRFVGPLYVEIKSAEKAVLYCLHPDRLVLEIAEREDITPPYYLHMTTIATLGKLLQSGKGWSTYFHSFQFWAKRVPDVFDSTLSTFLVANDSDDLAFGLKKLVEFRESDERITLSSVDRRMQVTCRRFCPHQGADLQQARFDGRFVICPRHQWKFDCQKGGFADNSEDTIDATLSEMV
jgi:UDP-MurNAc hydroxylase